MGNTSSPLSGVLGATLLACLALPAAVVAQTGRSMTLQGSLGLGSAFQSIVSYPSSAFGNVGAFLWSDHYIGTYPISVPGLTVFGSAKFDALTVTGLGVVVFNTGGQASMPVQIPNNPILLGAALDCQAIDININQSELYLADDDLEIVIGSSLAVRVRNVTPAGNYIRIPFSTGLQPANLTIDVAFKPEGPGIAAADSLGATVFGKPRQGLGGVHIYSWAMHWSPVTGRVTFGVSSNGNSQGVQVVSTTSVPVGGFARATGSVDGAIVKLYIDGVLQASAPWPYGSVYYGSDDILFGAANYCCGFLRRFDGAIDQASVWDRALSDAEVAQFSTTLAAGVGLQGLWNFEGSLLDSSGQGNHGVAVGVLNFVPGQ